MLTGQCVLLKSITFSYRMLDVILERTQLAALERSFNRWRTNFQSANTGSENHCDQFQGMVPMEPQARASCCCVSGCISLSLSFAVSFFLSFSYIMMEVGKLLTSRKMKTGRGFYQEELERGWECVHMLEGGGGTRVYMRSEEVTGHIFHLNDSQVKRDEYKKNGTGAQSCGRTLSRARNPFKNFHFSALLFLFQFRKQLPGAKHRSLRRCSLMIMKVEQPTSRPLLYVKRSEDWKIIR